MSLENLLPRSLKDITATGSEPFVFNSLDGGGGASDPLHLDPGAVLGDAEVRRQTSKHRKPPVYASRLAAGTHP